jgi:Fe-S-cluster-containing hydrogenase component 2
MLTPLQAVCPVNALHLVDEPPFHRGCVPGMGRCVDVCSQEAIELSNEYSQFVDKSITRLCSLVDLSLRRETGKPRMPTPPSLTARA